MLTVLGMRGGLVAAYDRAICLATIGTVANQLEHSYVPGLEDLAGIRY